MEISGKITVLKETQIIGASEFKKREVVITTNDQYPQPLLIEFVQDKCDLLNSFVVNDDVTVSINIRGREWESPTGEVKYFNTFQGWKIIIQKENSTIPKPPEGMIATEDTLDQIDELKNEEEDDNDLPF